MYVREYNDEITEDQKEFFQSQLTILIPQLFSLKGLKKNLGIAEATSILHANIYVSNFSMDKFISLIDDLQNYSKLLTSSKKKANLKDYEGQQVCDTQAQSLNAKYEYRLSQWKGNIR